MGSELEMHRTSWAWSMGRAGGSRSLGGLAECRGVIQAVLMASRADCNHEAGTIPKQREISFQEHAEFWALFSLLLRA